MVENVNTEMKLAKNLNAGTTACFNYKKTDMGRFSKHINTLSINALIEQVNVFSNFENDEDLIIVKLLRERIRNILRVTPDNIIEVSYEINLKEWVLSKRVHPRDLIGMVDPDILLN